MTNCEEEADSHIIERNVKPYKKFRKWIDCEVCRVGMAWLYKLNDELRVIKSLDYGEYELQNLLEAICESDKQSGKWIKTVDIKYNLTNKRIELIDIPNTRSNCDSECKTIELSCKHLTETKTDDITNFIWKKYNNDIYEGFDNDFIHNICNDTCNKYIKRRDNKLDKLLKDIEKYNIGKVGKETHGLNSLGLDEDQMEQLREVTGNIQNLAREFGYQYGQSGGDGVHDYRKKDKLSWEQRRAQESDDFVIPKPKQDL